jgi:hypothetical protein
MALIGAGPGREARAWLRPLPVDISRRARLPERGGSEGRLDVVEPTFQASVRRWSFDFPRRERIGRGRDPRPGPTRNHVHMPFTGKRRPSRSSRPDTTSSSHRTRRYRCLYRPRTPPRRSRRERIRSIEVGASSRTSPEPVAAGANARRRSSTRKWRLRNAGFWGEGRPIYSRLQRLAPTPRVAGLARLCGVARRAATTMVGIPEARR